MAFIEWAHQTRFLFRVQVYLTWPNRLARNKAVMTITEETLVVAWESLTLTNVSSKQFLRKRRQTHRQRVSRYSMLGIESYCSSMWLTTQELCWSLNNYLGIHHNKNQCWCFKKQVYNRALETSIWNSPSCLKCTPSLRRNWFFHYSRGSGPQGSVRYSLWCKRRFQSPRCPWFQCRLRRDRRMQDPDIQKASCFGNQSGSRAAIGLWGKGEQYLVTTCMHMYSDPAFLVLKSLILKPGIIQTELLKLFAFTKCKKVCIWWNHLEIIFFTMKLEWLHFAHSTILCSWHSELHVYIQVPAAGVWPVSLVLTAWAPSVGDLYVVHLHRNAHIHSPPRVVFASRQSTGAEKRGEAWVEFFVTKVWSNHRIRWFSPTSSSEHKRAAIDFHSLVPILKSTQNLDSDWLARRVKLQNPVFDHTARGTSQC